MSNIKHLIWLVCESFINCPIDLWNHINSDYVYYYDSSYKWFNWWFKLDNKNLPIIINYMSII